MRYENGPAPATNRGVGRSTLAATAVGLLGLVALGCAGNRQYTYSPGRCADNAQICEEQGQPAGGRPKRYRQSLRCFPYPDCADRTRAPGDYTLAVVEFDDQGELWEPEQLLAVRRRLRAREASSIVVVFIHGWKNNASRFSEKSKNLASFRGALERLSRADRGRREIIGVFFAWRGNSVKTIPSLWLGQQLTIFGRRAAARKVASVSASHSLHRIVNWAKERKPNCQGCQTFAVAVGHSLGALILENVLLRSLTVQTSHPKKTFPADLAVLVNSANPALLARQFLTGFERGPIATGGPECERVPDKECSGDDCRCYKVPMIVSMTSPWDSATRFLLPVEGWLTGLFNNFRRYQRPTPHGQSFYSRHAPGHVNDGELLTHEVLYFKPGAKDEALDKVPRRAVKAAREAMQDDSTNAAECLFPDLSEVSTWDCDQDGKRFVCFDRIVYSGCEPGSRYVVQRIPNTDREARNNAPYWVMTLPKRLISKHGDIFGGELSSLIAALVNLPGIAPDWELEEERVFMKGGLRSRSQR